MVLGAQCRPFYIAFAHTSTLVRKSEQDAIGLRLSMQALLLFLSSSSTCRLHRDATSAGARDRFRLDRRRGRAVRQGLAELYQPSFTLGRRRGDQLPHLSIETRKSFLLRQQCTEAEQEIIIGG